MKIKFFELSTGSNISELIARIAKTKYSNKNELGFLVSSLSDSHITAQYSIKLEHCEVIVDPFGNEEKIYVEKFLNINFSIIKGKTNFLVVRNPPRSIRSLIDSLNGLIDDNISVSTLVINPLNILDNLKDEFGSRNIKINEIKVSNHSISRNTSASMYIKSSGNILEDIKNLSISHEKIDKITVVLSINFKKLKVELSKNCFFLVPSEITDYLEHEVINQLRK